VKDRDTTDVAMVTVTVISVTLLVGQTATTTVYLNDTSEENPLVQYAQPGNELQDRLRTIDRIAEQNAGSPDVLFYYGERGSEYSDRHAFVERNSQEWDSSTYPHRYHCIEWYRSLPLGWYLRTDDVSIGCENDVTALSIRAQQSYSPIIITQNLDETVPETQLQRAGYVRRSYYHRDGGTAEYTAVWIHQSYIEGA
jgi:predicted membrane-bound mannosyltransferase